MGDKQPSPVLLAALQGLLPAAESWCEEIDYFGRKHADWIAIVYSAGRAIVEEISVRFDCRDEPSHALVDALCEIVRVDGGIELMDRDGVAIEANRAAVLAVIERSPAGKFRRDPEGAIRDAADSIPQE